MLEIQEEPERLMELYAVVCEINKTNYCKRERKLWSCVKREFKAGAGQCFFFKIFPQAFTGKCLVNWLRTQKR